MATYLQSKRKGSSASQSSTNTAGHHRQPHSKFAVPASATWKGGEGERPAPHMTFGAASKKSLKRNR